MRPEDVKASFVNPNIFYSLFDTDAYTFCQFFNDKTYFGKTCLTKKIGKNLNARSELVYCSESNNQIGLGANCPISLPNVSGGIKVLPLWIDRNGYVKDKVRIGYDESSKLPFGVNLSSFGELNVVKKEWGYGETALMKELSENLSFGLNLLMKKKADGMLTPKIDPTLYLKIKI